MRRILGSFSQVACLLFLAIFFTNDVHAQWDTLSNGLKSRSEVNSVIFKGKLYAFMGFRNYDLNVERSSEVYDPVNSTWSLLSEIPGGKAMTHQGAVLIDDNVWHIGGRVGKNPGPLTNEIWIYNITSDSWSPGPALTDPATGDTLKWAAGGAALLGRTLHIFGGFIIDACDHDQDKYHLTLDVDQWLADPSEPAQWKNELAPLPIKRNHFGTVVLGGKIYAIGGQFGHDCGGGQDQPYSHVYDPVTDKWTELPELPTPRSHIEGSTFAADGKIYIAGGQATNGVNTNKVTIFDPAGNNAAGSWFDDPNLTLPTRYEGLSAKFIDSIFIIDHGGKGSSQGVQQTAFSKIIKRAPLHTFGFSGGCTDFQLTAGSAAAGSAFLFTIDGTAAYKVSSSESWLTITKNATGIVGPGGADVGYLVSTKGLAPGKYSATLTATGTGGGIVFTPASHCVNIKVAANNTAIISDTLEAELAVLNLAIVDTDHAGYTGTGFVNYLNLKGDFIEWDLKKDNAGSIALTFRYANGALYNRPLQLQVNGAVVAADLAFEPTGGWDKWSTVTFNAKSIAGNNKIRLSAIGLSGPNIDHVVWKDLPNATAGILEAELATVHSATVSSNQPGFTGNGFVDYLHSDGDYIEWSLDRLSSGNTELDFRYANGSSYDRPLRLEVNGVILADKFSFIPTGDWTQWSTSSFTADLVQGTNTIRLTAVGYSGPNMDHLAWKEISQTTTSLNKTSTPLSEYITETKGKELRAFVAPNPASDNARIYFNGNAALPVEMVVGDMLGRIYKILQLKNTKSGYLDFSVRDLPHGSYFIHLRQGNESSTIRLIVK